jgi:hypothetical protein
LFYHIFGSTYVAVDVKTDGATFEAGIPRPLFDAANSSAIGGSPFVVTRDGQRFLVLAPAEAEKEAIEPLEVLVNWR